MTTFDCFEVVVVPFPFVDAPRAKPRPALVLSARGSNVANGHTLLAMITRASSVVRWKLFTLDNRIVLRRIGRLADRDAASCRSALGLMLGLAA